jgi:hypothetical protein
MLPIMYRLPIMTAGRGYFLFLLTLGVYVLKSHINCPARIFCDMMVTFPSPILYSSKIYCDLNHLQLLCDMANGAPFI